MSSPGAAGLAMTTSVTVIVNGRQGCHAPTANEIGFQACRADADVPNGLHEPRDDRRKLAEISEIPPDHVVHLVVIELPVDVHE